MEMQDNEFDELFRSKLDKIEAEPSANVWPGIAAELNAGKRNKAFMPFLSIAASIIVLVAAGILFIPQKEKVTGKHLVQNKIAKTSGTLITSPLIKSHSKHCTLKLLPSDTLNKTAISASSIAQSQHSKTTKAIAVKQYAEPDKAVQIDDQTALSTVSRNQQDVIKAVVPDESTQIAIKQPAAETTSFITKPVLLAVQLPVANKQDDLTAKPGRKLRSLGDMINIVVATVDKRKDKIIEFTDADDDGSTITGVNLGIIKIKKEK